MIYHYPAHRNVWQEPQAQGKQAQARARGARSVFSRGCTRRLRVQRQGRCPGQVAQGEDPLC